MDSICHNPLFLGDTVKTDRRSGDCCHREYGMAHQYIHQSGSSGDSGIIVLQPHPRSFRVGYHCTSLLMAEIHLLVLTQSLRTVPYKTWMPKRVVNFIYGSKSVDDWCRDSRYDKNCCCPAFGFQSR